MDFAKQQGFDPLLSYNWYTITANEIKSFKVQIPVGCAIANIFNHRMHNQCCIIIKEVWSTRYAICFLILG